jgi:hypothetical protein
MGFLEVYEYLMYCLILLLFSSNPTNAKKIGKYMICYVKTHTDGPQIFCLHMDLTLRGGYNFVCS